MIFSCKDSVVEDLRRQYRLRDMYVSQMRDRKGYKGWSLKTSVNHGRVYYYKYRKDAAGNPIKPIYLGRAHNDVDRIKEYKFSEKGLELVENNILMMEKFLDIYYYVDDDSIRSMLRNVYQSNSAAPVVPVSKKVEDWREELLERKRKHLLIYPEKYPDQQTERAWDGTMMRSRGEVTTYEVFHQYMIPALYEIPWEIPWNPKTGEHEFMYSPDFTVLRLPIWEVHIWEYLGVWYDPVKGPKYRERTLAKTDYAPRIGFRPNVNMHFSFDDPIHGFDVQTVHDQVRRIFGTQPSREDIIAVYGNTRL